MQSGRDTARSLAEQYMARIEAIDRSGPALHSVIELNPDALAIADRLDAERKSRGPRGPLHGIPMLIKDNIATADRMMTTAGSLALAGARPPKDAFIVERLRAAGAVILGKTNLSEWANFRSTHSTSGWSGRGGQTKNPYALDRNPSGSSSGSGAAIAANLSAAAIGTETDGSIVSPSSTNGLVGIKPTLGLVSRSGIVPIAHSQDTAGPMARTVADAAAILGAIAGADRDDPATQAGANRGAPAGRPAAAAVDYSTFLDAGGLKGARLGVVRNRLFGNNAAADAIAEAAIAAMKQQGATIVDPANIPTLGKFDDTEFDVLLFEFKADLNKYLDLARPGVAGPLAEGRHRVQRRAQGSGDAVLRPGDHGDGREEGAADERRLQDGAREESPAVARARHRRGDDQIQAGRAGRADRRAGVADRSRQRRRRHGLAPGPSTVTSVAGYPHITVPAGFFRGLPVGISFFGRAWSEPTLIKLAYAYEQATKHRRPPRFLPTADLARPITILRLDRRQHVIDRPRASVCTRSAAGALERRVCRGIPVATSSIGG